MDSNGRCTPDREAHFFSLLPWNFYTERLARRNLLETWEFPHEVSVSQNAKHSMSFGCRGAAKFEWHVHGCGGPREVESYVLIRTRSMPKVPSVVSSVLLRDYISFSRTP
ncbi:hypothetical protein CC2G_011594 [Coprinopsis cinerea AmutBmut pab1-1]|nr:hypothetical protein CC2G_011594 [Coprinopsis cinerea AmutBmut pab1-1]